ncbi:MAG TPA: isoprenylcysteine carboxylmethyltransferase family protein [Thermoanaerobaculia bacterium]|jgi:protein-S-isoprenylcysteine O-methyltransferase Ste14|nr:isoprenylcysteine carboxylmethyltransferase family protein [Thermoanaerobaculia bacterium]
MTALRHTVSILLLPATVTLVVPYYIVSSRPASLGTWPAATPLDWTAILAGACVLAAGLGLICTTVWQFATRGRGTLAPWDPPRHLVVAGVYRYVRNPMISGVVLVLLGEALVLRSGAVLAWMAVFFTINAIYIPLLEERGLERRFGGEYRDYKAHVPRWLPRVTAWEPPP